MDELYQQIIESYKETGSVKKTAEELGTYPIKVRRVLITEGLWHSRTSDQVAELLAKGKNVAEIAKELVISEKNVQSYMPYSRGQYGGEDRSSEAIRSEEYRERMQTAAKNQVTNTEARSKKQEEELQEKSRLLEELKAEKERLINEKKEFWDMIEDKMKRIPMAMQLHLELDMNYCDEEEKEILRKYGRMKDGITRDFIVPGTMSLHGLHYAIMKAFGWQNSHLHSYSPYEDEFKNMTDGGMVKEWTRQVGMYFRFPNDDYEDQYWDDDYEEGESVKSWLRSKYCGPYYYGGVGEHYLPAQMEVDRFRKKYPAIQKKTTDQREWGVFFEGRCEEMIERPKICMVLKTPTEQTPTEQTPTEHTPGEQTLGEQTDWDAWKAEKEASLKQVEPNRKTSIKKYKELKAQLKAAADKAMDHFDKNGVSSSSDMAPYYREIEAYDNEIDDLCMENNPEPIPALSALCYRYDYGDDWEIRITCTNAWYDRSTYARDAEGNMLWNRNGFVPEKTLFVDAFDQQVGGEFLEKLIEIARKEKPVCIAWDGMNLIDDVGGIHGFCEFLETINGNDPEEKKYYKTWARGLGWTGRMPKPENIL